VGGRGGLITDKRKTLTEGGAGSADTAKKKNTLEGEKKVDKRRQERDKKEGCGGRGIKPS